MNIDNLEQIMNAYMPLIRANARQFSRFDFDETVDESKMILIDAIGEYDQSKGTFGNFLKNKLRYYYLDKAKKPIENSLDALDETGTPLVDGLVSDVDIAADMERAENYQALCAAIEKLDEKDRAIIKMKYWEDLTNKDIGEALGISPKTVANRASLALVTLKKILES